MTFFGLIAHNLWTKKVRTVLTALAVAVGVLTVVTLSVVTQSLRSSAAAVLETGNADFTVAQKGVDGALNSVIDDAQVKRLQQAPGVQSAIGVLVDLAELDADNPAFLEIGIEPASLADFGVHVVAGRAYTANAKDEVLLGWRAADNLGKHVGDSIVIAGGPKTVVGIYRTGQAFGDGGAMFPLVFLQAEEQRKPSERAPQDPASRFPRSKSRAAEIAAAENGRRGDVAAHLPVVENRHRAAGYLVGELAECLHAHTVGERVVQHDLQPARHGLEKPAGALEIGMEREDAAKIAGEADTGNDAFRRTGSFSRARRVHGDSGLAEHLPDCLQEGIEDPRFHGSSIGRRPAAVKFRVPAAKVRRMHYQGPAAAGAAPGWPPAVSGA